MKGKIDITQLITPPERHELDTARFFSSLGKDIEFIRPSNIPGVYSPDIIMDGVEWEIKSPKGKGKRTIEKSYHKASLQAKNIIFDLRRINLPDRKCVAQLKKEFSDKHTNRLLIIKHNGELIELKQ